MINTMEKPKKPVEPILKNYPTPKEPNGKNHLGQPLFQKLDWIKDMVKYQEDLERHKADMELYEQIKLIRLVKNSTEKYCLNNLKITKNK